MDYINFEGQDFQAKLRDKTIMTPSPLDPSNHEDRRFRYSVGKGEGYVMVKSSSSPIWKRRLVCQTVMIFTVFVGYIMLGVETMWSLLTLVIGA